MSKINVLTTYAEASEYIRGFADGKLRFVAMLGEPGLAKSTMVRSQLGDRAVYVEGNATSFGVYCKLHENIDRPFVFDDADSLGKDPAGIRLLRALCQTEREKRVQWNSAATGDDVPSELTTKSPVMFIANDIGSMTPSMRALLDRGHVLRFDPSPDEIHANAATWFDDQEVLSWIGENLHQMPNISLRDYVKASELKAASIDWKKTLLSSVPYEQRVVLELLGDSTLEKEAARVRAFIERTGKTRATYFNYKKRLKSASKPMKGRQAVLKPVDQEVTVAPKAAKHLNQEDWNRMLVTSLDA